MYHGQIKAIEPIVCIFNAVVKECHRSYTKHNLHVDPAKEALLATQLEITRVKYAATFSDQFQKVHEKQNPGLSFLFAQVINAIFEKTFHEGQCHAQAAYTLIELCKKNIFNASLVCSRTNDPTTEHWYLLLFDDNTLKELANQPSQHPVYFRFSPNNFHKKWIYFDSWSNQLCLWENFQPQNNSMRAIKNSPQATFKPLIHLFRDETSVLEKIIWCLNEYENCLKALTLTTENIPLNISKLFSTDDGLFQKEIELLFDSRRCQEKLLLTIENYKQEFAKTLNLHKQPSAANNKNDTSKEKEEKLSSITSAFFHQKQTNTQWKEFPASHLANTRYTGHKVLFFTMRKDMSTQANEFFNHLKEKGADVVLKEVGKNDDAKPSIVLDLTSSTFKS